MVRNSRDICTRKQRFRTNFRASWGRLVYNFAVLAQILFTVAFIWLEGIYFSLPIWLFSLVLNMACHVRVLRRLKSCNGDEILKCALNFCGYYLNLSGKMSNSCMNIAFFIVWLCFYRFCSRKFHKKWAMVPKRWSQVYSISLFKKFRGLPTWLAPGCVQY